jgi:alginate O-acetyltransferase complex protein AlgI
MRRQFNLAATMLLGGLWHGAGWTFVVWGGLHGLYLMINHAWRALLGDARTARLGMSRLYAAASWMLTLLAVVVAWVFFRAETFGGAGRVLQAMAGFGTPGNVQVQLWNAGLSLHVGVLWCVALGAAALFAPNSNRIGEWLLEALARPLVWRPAVAGATGVVVMSLLLINVARDSVSAFIYFNF